MFRGVSGVLQSPAATAASRSMRMSATDDSFVPDMSRRQTMNLILAASFGVNVVGLAVPYLAFFVPPGAGGAGGGVVARDAVGNDVTVDSWIATHPVGSRELAEGIKVRKGERRGRPWIM